MTAPRLFRDKDAATYCGLPVAAFRRSCPVVPVRIGEKLRFDRKDLDAWIDAVKSGAAADVRAEILGRLE